MVIYIYPQLVEGETFTRLTIIASFYSCNGASLQHVSVKQTTFEMVVCST
jgi:hypothetical protein